MAFKFVKSLSGENFPAMRSISTTANTAIPADAALSLAGGKAAVAEGAAKPAFVSAGAAAAAASPADTPAQIVLPHYIWETTFAADAAAVSEGDKVTIHTDGLQVTATTTNGAATIVRKFGNAAGAKVWVRFE